MICGRLVGGGGGGGEQQQAARRQTPASRDHHCVRRWNRAAQEGGRTGNAVLASCCMCSQPPLQEAGWWKAQSDEAAAAAAAAREELLSAAPSGGGAGGGGGAGHSFGFGRGQSQAASCARWECGRAKGRSGGERILMSQTQADQRAKPAKLSCRKIHSLPASRTWLSWGTPRPRVARVSRFCVRHIVKSSFVDLSGSFPALRTTLAKIQMHFVLHVPGCTLLLQGWSSSVGGRARSTC